jgi:ABC-type polysaccharide/polyol phosphate export permease
MSDATMSAAAGPQAGTDGFEGRDRALFLNFFRREIGTRYVGSMTGLAWALVHPLALLAVYAFVFTTMFRAGLFEGTSVTAFVAVALWPWLAAQEALQRGTTSLAAYAGLIRKVAMPHEIIVYASVAATLALQFAGHVLVLIVLAIAGEPIHLSGLIVAIPIWLVLAIGIAGIALALASLQVFVRDVEHVLMPVLMILMYLTPILYPLTAVPASVQPVIAMNPFAWLVGRLRDALLQGNLAPQPGDAIAVGVAVTLLLAGRWLFRRLAPYFEDFV